MKRRDFIHSTAAGIGLAMLHPETLAPPSKGSHNPAIGSRHASTEVVVVGAGAFGGWTAFYLREMGASVTLVDAYGPGNSRSSSGGETRLMQSDAGERTVYARLAGLAYKKWVHWQEAWGEELILPTGRLALGPDARRSVALERKQYMEKAGITDVELLEIEELQYRWPQLNYEGFGIGLFNSGGAGGSTIRAREACQCVARAFVNNAGKLQTGHARPGQANGSRLEEVVLSNAESISAQHFVFACGPWLPKLFPELLGNRLQVQRRDVFFFGTPPGDSRFNFPNLPEWSFQGTGYYGFPVIDGRGLKVAPYPDYNALDPDTDERIVNPYSAKRAHDFVNERFPALRGQPITENRVCQVTNSIDSHFIVDTHPDYNNVWIVGGGSGHGFKHGPGLGEYLARRVLEGEGDPEFDEVFRLKEEMF